MSAEHKRPLVAFITVALLCGLFMGHAIRSEALAGVLRALPGPAADLLQQHRPERGDAEDGARAGGPRVDKPVPPPATASGAGAPVREVRPGATRLVEAPSVGHPAKTTHRTVSSRPGPRVPTPPGESSPQPPAVPPSDPPVLTPPVPPSGQPPYARHLRHAQHPGKAQRHGHAQHPGETQHPGKPQHPLTGQYQEPRTTLGRSPFGQHPRHPQGRGPVPPTHPGPQEPQASPAPTAPSGPGHSSPGRGPQSSGSELSVPGYGHGSPHGHGLSGPPRSSRGGRG